MTQSPDFQRRWAVAGAELARMISEFDVAIDVSDNADQEILCHHEQSDSIQTTYTQQLNALVEVIKARTVDTDVVILAISSILRLKIKELWLTFGTSNLRYIPAHEIAESLGPDKSKALPLFHAYTGCDIMSSFANREKRQLGHLECL